MEVLCSRCAGLDVHKDTVVACAGGVGWCRPARGAHVQHHHPGASGAGGLAGRARRHTRRHRSDRCLLETGLARAVGWRSRADPANAAHVKNVPGRTTDVADASWLADLLARPAPRQLRAKAGHPGNAGIAAHPQATGPRAGWSPSGYKRRWRTPPSNLLRC
jgi:hypothetical protein